MTEKFIRNEQWYVKTLIQKIKNGDIIKPKYQRKKKWDILPEKENTPNEQSYINFLFETQHSVHAITFGQDKSALYMNIDGNNRINAIYHFMNCPFDLFEGYIKKLFMFIDKHGWAPEIVLEIKEKIKKMSYSDVMEFKFTRFFGDSLNYKTHLQMTRDEFEPLMEEIQDKLKINKIDRFDTHVKISVNLFDGYSTDELCKIFEKINKFNSKLTEIELLACRLYNETNFMITDPVISAQINEALADFYEKKSEDEVLSCYQFDKNGQMNAYDFMVGFQNHCHTIYPFIEETDAKGLSLFFKLYQILQGDEYTTVCINLFIKQVLDATSVLEKINKTSFSSNTETHLFNPNYNEKLNSLKKNNICLVLSAIIGFMTQNVPENEIIQIMIRPLFYHFMCHEIKNKEKRTEMVLYDTIRYEAGGTYIEKMAKEFYETPFKIAEKCIKERMQDLVTLLQQEGNRPHQRTKNDKRRSRQFYEKTLIFFYYKEHVPINLLKQPFDIEHLVPFSCQSEEGIDIDRLGNIIPIPSGMNRTRGNRHISSYLDKEFITYIKEMIPSEYDSMVSHANRSPELISNEVYIKFCETNEQRYLYNFIKCLYE